MEQREFVAFRTHGGCPSSIEKAEQSASCDVQCVQFFNFLVSGLQNSRLTRYQDI